MTRVRGAYASIIRGVSQQAPHDRVEGQMGEQVNMLSDPVRGLVRRNGFVLDSRETIPLTATAAELDEARADAGSYRRYAFTSGRNQYDLLFRSRARVGDSAANLPAILAAQRFFPVGLIDVVQGPGLEEYEEGGISAVTLVGRYLLIAGNTVRPEYTVTDNFASQSSRAAVQVKTGAFSRTYTLTFTRASDNATFTVSHTTPTANYPGELDISGVDWESDTYQQEVNELIYAYESAQSEWLASSAAATVPSAIAQALYDALVTAGAADGWNVVSNALVHENLTAVTATDSANGDAIKVSFSTIDSVDDLSSIHFVGKVVQIKPLKNSEESYYLVAEREDETDTANPARVVWRETAGQAQTPTKLLSMATLEGGKLYWASGPEELKALVLAETTVELDIPTYIASTSGDVESVEPPNFFKEPITLLTTFQDRLVVGSGNVLNISAIGEYFNFYRQSVLTQTADDPAEWSATGTSGDVLRQATTYDRNLMLVGDRFHYIIPGRQAIDPNQPTLAVQYTIQGTSSAAPVGSGQFVFILKEDTQLASSSLLQVQAGVWQDSPALGEPGKQLRDYVNGTPAELVALTAPSVVFIRTEPIVRGEGAFPPSRPSGLYVYQYMDGEDGARQTDAWHAWQWDPALGQPIGIGETATGDGLLLYTVVFSETQREILLMSVSARPDPTGLPYLDGLTKAADAAELSLFDANAYTVPDAVLSFVDPSGDNSIPHPHYTVGDGPPEAVDPFRWTGVQGKLLDYALAYPEATNLDYLWTGLGYESYVDLTNPYMRDRNGRARTLGHLKITRFNVTTTRTSGLKAWVRDYYTQRLVYDEGGTYHRMRYGASIFAGRDTLHFQARLGSKDWYPLTINSITWEGNWFDNGRQV